MTSKKVGHTFSATDCMADLITDDFNILPFISCFGIPLGLGNKSIGEICDNAGIDTDTFLLIINFVRTGIIPPSEYISAKMAVGIVDFLHNSHEYFLGYKFPHIRANLTSALDTSHSDINPAIIGFFDDYVGHVRQHFEYEEQNVWPYIRNLQSNIPSTYNISTYKGHHEEIGEALADLKNIILRYYTTSMPNRMYDVLVDIFNCEEALERHNDIENHILIPLIASIEQQKKA